MNLNNYNIANAMLDFQKILSNRYWIQRNQELRPQFDIKDSDFFKNNERVLKALACGENKIYIDDSSTSIKNLFANDRSKSKDLLYIYIIRYLMNFSGNDDEYTMTTSNVRDFFRNFKIIFEESLKNVVLTQALKDMIKLKLIEYSPDHSGRASKEFFLMPRAHETWTLLIKNSILLELYREDIWRETDRGYDFRPSEELKDDKSVLFSDIIKYVEEVFEFERTIIESCIRRNYARYYSDFFGQKLLAEYLLEAIEKSIEKIFENDEVSFLNIKEKISKIQDDINDFVTLFLENLNQDLN